MDQIWEIFLEALVTNLEEQVGVKTKKCKLASFVEKLKDEIQKNYINKYEREEYFMSLDGFLATTNFYERIVRNIFSKTSQDSNEKLSNEVVDKFINEYPNFNPVKQQIRKAVLELAENIYTGFLNSNILDDKDVFFIRMQESINKISEDTTESKNMMRQMMSKFDSLTYNFEKREKRQINKDDYIKLHKILCNEKISFFERELEYIKWIEKYGDLKEGLIYIASNCEKANELNRAKKYYEYILGLDEKEYELYNNWGTIELRQGQKEEAKKRFKQVLRYDENNINALYNLAIAYHTHGTCCENALAYIEKAFKLNPLDADVVSFYAVILLEKDTKNCDYASNILNVALIDNPDNFYLNINLGYVYLFQKKFIEGITLLEKLNQKYPNQIECVSLLGIMYAMIGVEDAEKAIPLFEQAYNITKEQGYLENIKLVRQGLFFDSVMYNHKQYMIYSDEELYVLSKKK